MQNFRQTRIQIQYQFGIMMTAAMKETIPFEIESPFRIEEMRNIQYKNMHMTPNRN